MKILRFKKKIKISIKLIFIAGKSASSVLLLCYDYSDPTSPTSNFIPYFFCIWHFVKILYTHVCSYSLILQSVR